MLPQYAAPEIFDRQATYTQAVDMWSLGVSLYAMSVIITQSLKTKKFILTNKLQQPALQALWTTALRCGGGLQQAPEAHRVDQQGLHQRGQRRLGSRSFSGGASSYLSPPHRAARPQDQGGSAGVSKPVEE